MKFTKKRDYTGSIRKVWSDDKEVCFGVVGTVGDLLREGIFEYCDYSPKSGHSFRLPARSKSPVSAQLAKLCWRTSPKCNNLRKIK